MRTLRGVIVFTLVTLLSASVASTAPPRAFGKKGTATTTNATVTFAFHPVRLCVRNDDATNGLYIDWTDGVATTGDESTNLYLPPATLECYEFSDRKSPNETFTVGTLAAAATTAYHINAYRAN